MKNLRPIKIVIAALGGQGGGVLAGWIAQLAHNAGWPCQSTSVPGVAQRTGATIYYIEMFPAKKADLPAQPVLSLFPTRGDVDVVIASEIVEAGRMLERGFITPQNTHLISSSHRVYAVGERVGLGDATIDADKIHEISLSTAKQLTLFDMQTMAEKHATVISACLFGALAGTGVLPFEAGSYEELLSDSGVANQNAFAEARKVAADHNSTVKKFDPVQQKSDTFHLPDATTKGGEDLLRRISGLPVQLHKTAYYGVSKLADYLDHAYAERYLAQVEEIVEADSEQKNYELSVEFAKQLALWSSFEDIIRVAHLKIKTSRQVELAKEVGLEEGQVLHIRDFFKPRVEEMCGLMPYSLGRFCTNSTIAQRFLGVFSSGKQLTTSHVSIFLLLRLIAGLRRFRRSTYAYQCEQERMQAWLKVLHNNVEDYEKALAITRFASVVRGYSATRERGYRQMRKMLGVANGSNADDIVKLLQAALEDDEALSFSRALSQLATKAA